MACSQISGYTYDCLQNTGGVKNIYITKFANVSGFTANAIGTITGMTMVGGATFQEFSFQPNTSSMEEDLTQNLEAGTGFFTQKVALVIPRRSAALRNKLLVLSAGQPKLAVIVKDQNGLFWFIGATNGAYLTAAKSGSGTKKNDANNYTLEITGEEPLSAPEVDSALITSLI